MAGSRIVYNKLKAKELWATFEQYCINSVKFTDNNLSTATVSLVMQGVLAAFDKYPEYNYFILACLKLSLPSDDGLPWM